MNSASQELRTVFFLLDPLALLSSSGSNFKSHIYLWLLTVSIQNLFSSPDNSLLHCWHLLLPFWSHRYILSKFRIFLWCTFFLLFLQADAILIFPKCCFSFITLFHSQYFINFTSHHYPTSMCLSNIYFLPDAILGIVDTMIKKKQKHKSLYSKENLKCCEEIKTKKASLYHVHSYFCA